MKWVENKRVLLSKAFGSKAFRAADAVKILKKMCGVKPGSAYRILSELEKNAGIEKLGRGVYRVNSAPERKIEATTPKFVKRLALELEKSGVRGQITGLPVLLNYVNLVPRRIIYLVYAPRGSGEQTAELLGNRNRVSLVNPSRNEIKAVLSAVGNKDVVVVRENKGFDEGKAGIAPVEKALVDFYFEVLRKKIPFPENEAGRIISGVLTSARIDLTKLSRAATRRGIRAEIDAIVYFKKPEAQVSNKPLCTAKLKQKHLGTVRGI